MPKKKQHDPRFFDPNKYKNWLTGPVVAALLMFLSCSKQSDAPNIEGVWVDTITPEWVYHFSGGLAVVRNISNGQENYRLEYAYRQNGNTVYLDNIFTDQAAANRVWRVSFPKGDSAEVMDVTDGGLVYFLKRLP
ncbi:MAG: hypothetical protein KDC70_00325 [Saprospiraceae bacterium]|nr:hypothetical protein [Saprospiraceae bacterium]